MVSKPCGCGALGPQAVCAEERSHWQHVTVWSGEGESSPGLEKPSESA
jgi:hypothetical protein